MKPYEPFIFILVLFSNHLFSQDKFLDISISPFGLGNDVDYSSFIIDRNSVTGNQNTAGIDLTYGFFLNDKFALSTGLSPRIYFINPSYLEADIPSSLFAMDLTFTVPIIGNYLIPVGNSNNLFILYGGPSLLPTLNTNAFASSGYFSGDYGISYIDDREGNSEFTFKVGANAGIDFKIQSNKKPNRFLLIGFDYQYGGSTETPNNYEYTRRENGMNSIVDEGTLESTINSFSIKIGKSFQY